MGILQITQTAQKHAQNIRRRGRKGQGESKEKVCRLEHFSFLIQAQCPRQALGRHLHVQGTARGAQCHHREPRQTEECKGSLTPRLFRPNTAPANWTNFQ